MKLLIVFSAVLLLVKAVPVEEEWKKFKQLYQKTYLSLEDEQKRLAIFRRNLDNIYEHNYKYSKGETTFRMHVSKFADLSPDEFRKTLTYKPSKDSIKEINQAVPVKYEGNIDVDHRKTGCVTNVKDQGDCGSCWAFSAVGGMEGQLKKTSCVSLSAQYLVDCSTPYGCMGGRMNTAFNWTMSNGEAYEKDYPYTGDAGICHPAPTIKVTGYTKITPKDENAIMKYLLQNPVSTALDATALQFYQDGIMKPDCGCSSDPEDMNHGVLMIGVESENNALIFKNSWGVNWGMNGYFMMEMNNNTCGCSNEASFPQLAF